MIVKRMLALYQDDKALGTWRNTLKSSIIFLLCFLLSQHVFFIAFYDAGLEKHRTKTYIFDCDGQDKLNLTMHSPLLPGAPAEMSTMFLAWLTSVIMTGFLHAL